MLGRDDTGAYRTGDVLNGGRGVDELGGGVGEVWVGEGVGEGVRVGEGVGELCSGELGGEEDEDEDDLEDDLDDDGDELGDGDDATRLLLAI